MRKIIAILLTLALVFTMGAVTVFATDFTVSTSADLISAIGSAIAGDTISVSGTINLTAALVVSKDVTIIGIGTNPTITSSLDGFAITMNQGEIKNLTIIRPTGDGPNLNASGVYLSGSSKLTNSIIKNFRTGVHATANNVIVGNKIEGNRTGLIYVGYTATPVVTITGNTITDNRTFGILFNVGGVVFTNGYSFTITENKIYGNWFAEFETRTVSPLNISQNYWGTQGPKLIYDYANETLSPMDAGGSNITTKPDRPAGGIYQPTNSTSITRSTDPAFQNFTAGKLTLTSYYSSCDATVVKANADVTYMVIIPSSVNFGTINKTMGTQLRDFPVSVESAFVEVGSLITITNTTLTMTMKDKNGTGTATLPFTLTTGGIFTFAYGDLTDGHETIASRVSCTPANLTAAGSYSGTMTFTVAYTPAP